MSTKSDRSVTVLSIFPIRKFCLKHVPARDSVAVNNSRKEIRLYSQPGSWFFSICSRYSCIFSDLSSKAKIV